MVSTLVLSVIISFGVNYGCYVYKKVSLGVNYVCYVYKKAETNKAIDKIEEKQTPLSKDCAFEESVEELKQSTGYGKIKTKQLGIIC